MITFVAEGSTSHVISYLLSNLRGNLGHPPLLSVRLRYAFWLELYLLRCMLTLKVSK